MWRLASRSGAPRLATLPTSASCQLSSVRRQALRVPVTATWQGRLRQRNLTSSASAPSAFVDMEAAVSTVGRLLASPQVRDREEGHRVVVGLVAHQSLPHVAGAVLSQQGATRLPEVGHLHAADGTSDLLAATAADSPTQALQVARFLREGRSVSNSPEVIHALLRGCLAGGHVEVARQLFLALHSQEARSGRTLESTTYTLGMEAVGRCRASLPEVRALIDEVVDRSVALDGRLVGTMITALAHKRAYGDALTLYRKLQAAHPHLSSPPHSLDVHRSLLKASSVTGDLHTCLAAAYDIQKITRSAPDLETLTDVLHCYSRSALFEKEHASLLRYLSSLGFFPAVGDSPSLSAVSPLEAASSTANASSASPGAALTVRHPGSAAPAAAAAGDRLASSGAMQAPVEAQSSLWLDVVRRALLASPSPSPSSPSSSSSSSATSPLSPATGRAVEATEEKTGNTDLLLPIGRASDPGDGALHLLELILRSQATFLGERVTLRQLNPVVYTLVRLGQLERALRLVEEMQARGLYPDIATHNTLLKGFALRGDAPGAVRYYNAMLRQGARPQKHTYLALLRAQSEVVAREVGTLRPAAVGSSQRYDLDEASPDRRASLRHIQETYSQLLLEMQAHGTKPSGKLLSSLVHGMSLAGLVDAALPLAESALTGRDGKPREQPDEKLFTNLLLGISLQSKPSSEMASRVLALMESVGVAPTRSTYHTLIRIHAKALQNALRHPHQRANPKRPLSEMPLRHDVTLSPQAREAGREALMKALAVYFTMRLQATRPTNRGGDWTPSALTGASSSSSLSSDQTMDTVTFNCLVALVGTEDLLDVSYADLDELFVRLAGPSAAPSTTSATTAAPTTTTTLPDVGRDLASQAAWTSLPLAQLRERYAREPLPLSAYVPAERQVKEMTPLELLAWRDLAANNVRPNRISYNHLIVNLATAGRLSSAEHYLRFVLDHHNSSSGAPELPLRPGEPGLLRRQHNLTYSSNLIQQRLDRQSQFAKLLAKTPRSGTPVLPPQAGDTPSGTLTMPKGPQEGSPLYLKTLWRLGREYLLARRFDDFVGCYRLATLSYPISAVKCFGFLLRAWRSPNRSGLSSDPEAEHLLQSALRKYAVADPMTP